jgi:hypothetical protein
MSDFAVANAAPQRVAFFKRPLVRWLGLTVVVSALSVTLFTLSGAASTFRTPTAEALRSPDHQISSCRAGSRPAVIGGIFRCLRAGQICKGRYEKAYRKYGFSCTYGHLRKWSAPLPPPPAPLPPPLAPPAPAAPAATPGHYRGLTSQMTTFDFDVISNGSGVASLVTGQVNQGCTPAFHVSGGQINIGTYVIPVAADGSFGVSWSGGGTVGSVAAIWHTSITGHLSGATAVGNLEETTSFTWTNGVAYACGSGLQTWTATRTG